MQVLNTNRGLWGYTGTAADGAPLTIQSTGMGGPSAAIVAEELIALGARRLVRVGTCGALAGGRALGDLLVAGAALCADGASRALGAGERAEADPEPDRRARARRRAPPVTVVSADLFYDPDPERAPALGGRGRGGGRDGGGDAVHRRAPARRRRRLRAGRLRRRRRRASRIGDDALTPPSCALGEAALAAL